MLNNKIGLNFNSTKLTPNKHEIKDNSKNIGFGADEYGVPGWGEIAQHIGKAIQSRLPLRTQGFEKNKQNLIKELSAMPKEDIANLMTDPIGRAIVCRVSTLSPDPITRLNTPTRVDIPSNLQFKINCGGNLSSKQIYDFGRDIIALKPESEGGLTPKAYLNKYFTQESLKKTGILSQVPDDCNPSKRFIESCIRSSK